MDMQVGVGISTNLLPENATDEAAKLAISKVSGNITAILLLCTIHYKSNNGFQKMFNKIRFFKEKNTQLIGGTIAGFMSREGEFTRGVAVVVFSAPPGKIKSGTGSNTKKNPGNAILEASKDFDKGNNNSIIEFTSGPIRPRMPIVGEKFVVKSAPFSAILRSMMKFSTENFQMGFGREEEVIEGYSKFNATSNIIGGSTCDDNKVLDAYEFFSERVQKNSTVALQFVDMKTKIRTIHGYDATGKILTVTKMSTDGRIISEIEGMPAISKFCEVTGIPLDRIDEKLHKKTFFIPFGYRDKVNFMCPMAVGGVLGNSFYFSHGIKGNKIELLTSSGGKLKEEAFNLIDKLNDDNPLFVFGIGCVSWISTLGRKISMMRAQFNKLNSDYFIAFTMGEDYFSPETTDRHTNESFNTLSFLRS